MTGDKEEELSLFDKWEKEAAEQRTREDLRRVTQVVKENQELAAQVKESGQKLHHADVNAKEMSHKEQVDFRTNNLETRNPLWAEQYQDGNAIASIEEAGKMLHQSGAETRDISNTEHMHLKPTDTSQPSPFDRWEAQAKEKSQQEPQQQKTKEQDRER